MTPRASQAQGRNFEDVLEWIHRDYLNKGRAAIYHNHVAGKFVSRGLFVPDPGKARPDYSGTLAANALHPFGISVHFDAKTMNDTCGWRLPAERMHQYEMLLDQARMGALAFFLVECRTAAAVYLLRVHPDIPVVDGRPEIMFAGVPPADAKLEQRVNRRERILPTTIPEFCVLRNEDGLYDWLTAVEVFWICRRELPPQPRGRPLMPSSIERNKKICYLVNEKGLSMERVGKEYHLSRNRISQILLKNKIRDDARLELSEPVSHSNQGIRS